MKRLAVSVVGCVCLALAGVAPATAGPLEDQLIDAAKRGDVSEIIRLHGQGADTAHKDARGMNLWDHAEANCHDIDPRLLHDAHAEATGTAITLQRYPQFSLRISCPDMFKALAPIFMELQPAPHQDGLQVWQATTDDATLLLYGDYDRVAKMALSLPRFKAGSKAAAGVQRLMVACLRIAVRPWRHSDEIASWVRTACENIRKSKPVPVVLGGKVHAKSAHTEHKVVCDTHIFLSAVNNSFMLRVLPYGYTEDYRRSLQERQVASKLDHAGKEFRLPQESAAFQKYDDLIAAHWLFTGHRLSQAEQDRVRSTVSEERFMFLDPGTRLMLTGKGKHEAAEVLIVGHVGRWWVPAHALRTAGVPVPPRGEVVQQDPPLDVTNTHPKPSAAVSTAPQIPATK
ncbi:MAG: hypothetical protein AB1646_20445 [Thermodesulfobacteriota bacterium]